MAAAAEEALPCTTGENVPHRVGCVDNPNATKIRIVHISDTHLAHDQYLDDIPDGDILVHSGDFGQLGLGQFIWRSSDYLNQLRQITDFFSKLPHRHKIFVAGNHETNFSRHTVTETQSRLHPHGIYLQDSSVIIEGIKFYGSPWNGIRSESYARGFGVPYDSLAQFWSCIPEDTDVLITHQPAMKLLDFGRLRKGSKKEYHCPHCNTSHGNGYFHLGCSSLRDELFNRIRPSLHCFGHVHEDYGIIKEDSIVFSNAAMKLQKKPSPNIIDYYHVNGSVSELTPIHYYTKVHRSCVIQ